MPITSPDCSLAVLTAVFQQHCGGSETSVHPSVCGERGNGDLPTRESDLGLRLPVASAANTAHAAALAGG